MCRPQRRRQWKQKKDLLPERKKRNARMLTTFHAKLLSFGYSASGVAWNRFCSLWLLKCGFSPRQVGAMKSLSLVGKLLAQPMWAACADSKGNPPFVLAVSIGLSMLALELLRLGTRGEFYYDEIVKHSPSRIPFSRFWTLLGLGDSSRERSHHAVAAVIQDSVDKSGHAAFLAWRVAFFRVARSAASAASPVADAMVLALARDGGEAWGRQRFWGSASWGLGSVAVGAIIDSFGLEWGLFGCSHLLSMILLVFLVTRIEPHWHAQLGTSKSVPTKPTDETDIAAELLTPAGGDTTGNLKRNSSAVVHSVRFGQHQKEHRTRSDKDRRSDDDEYDEDPAAPFSRRSRGLNAMTLSMRGPSFPPADLDSESRRPNFLGWFWGSSTTPRNGRTPRNGGTPRPVLSPIKCSPTAVSPPMSPTTHKALAHMKMLDNPHASPTPSVETDWDDGLPVVKKNGTTTTDGDPPTTGGPQIVKKKKRQPCCVAVTRGLLAVRRCAPLRLALLNSIAFGTLVVSVDSILYMQLENELAVSRTLSGLATAASTVATFPVFWSSAEIVARHGYWRIIALAQCILPIRLLLHACVTKANVAYILLPIQLLHGPMFAAWISAAVELVDRLAPADLRASTQSLLTMSYFTLGGCLGHLIWSTTFELYGGPITYLLAAAAACVSVLAFAIAASSHLRADRQRFIRISSSSSDLEVLRSRESGSAFRLVGPHRRRKTDGGPDEEAGLGYTRGDGASSDDEIDKSDSSGNASNGIIVT